MKKDNVYEAGAQDVILVKYISNVLENKFEDYGSSNIKTRFRWGVVKFNMRLSIRKFRNVALNIL
jgi:hypothetical protein